MPIKRIGLALSIPEQHAVDDPADQPVDPHPLDPQGIDRLAGHGAARLADDLAEVDLIDDLLGEPKNVGFGLSALEAGLATLPAAGAMIAVTPLITPLAVRIGARSAVALGFGLAAIGCAALAFVNASWTYAAFVLPLIAIAVGLGLANGPASSASTASVAPEEVGQASGISNMARYIGGSLAPHRLTPWPLASLVRRCCWRSCRPPASRWRYC